jgi:large subunit ribosomal protein L7/L12
MADLNKLVEELSTLSVLEASELVKQLEEKWGVSAAAPVAAAAAGPAAAAAEPVEEKTEFDVVIKETGAKKIDVIRVVRQLTSLGLKEAKEVAETPGAKVMEAVGKEAANDAKSKLEAVGAVVDVVISIFFLTKGRLIKGDLLSFNVLWYILMLGGHMSSRILIIEDDEAISKISATRFSLRGIPGRYWPPTGSQAWPWPGIIPPIWSFWISCFQGSTGWRLPGVFEQVGLCPY